MTIYILFLRIWSLLLGEIMSKKWFENEDDFELNFPSWYDSLNRKWKQILSYVSVNGYLDDLPSCNFEDTPIIDSSEIILRMGTQHIQCINISTILYGIIQTGGHSRFGRDSKVECYELKIPIFDPVTKSYSNYHTAHELYLDNLQPLEIFFNISSLNLKGVYIQNQDFLFDMKTLKYLNIVRCPIFELERIQELVNLEFLYISNPYNSVNENLLLDYHLKLENLKKLKNLKKLELQGWWKFELLDCLNTFTQLDRLTIQQPLTEKNFEKICKLKNLKSLEIGIHHDLSLSKITNNISSMFPNLENLHIHNSHIDNFRLTQKEEFEDSLNWMLIPLKKVKLYLDIDGLLLTKRGKYLPENIEEFIEYILENFDCYWLTTHCKGDKETALNYLSGFYPSHLIEKLKLVKPTNWKTLKTEAIDFESEFFWLDDEPLQVESMKFKTLNLSSKLIKVDLNNNFELERIIGKLKAIGLNN